MTRLHRAKTSSIQRRLLGSTLAIFLIAWLIILQLALSASREPFIERVDREVAVDAQSVLASLRILARLSHTRPDELDRQDLTQLLKRGEGRALRIWSGEHLLARSDDPLPPRPVADPSMKPGYSTFEAPLGDQTYYWRLFRVDAPDLGVEIVAAHDLRDLGRYVDGLLLHFFWPLLAALPIALLALVIGIRYGLKPLAAASDEIRHRDAADLGPIQLDAPPREIVPLLDAIEDLFARLERAFAAERRFTADASHELRTPLAALKVNAQLLESERPELRELPAFAGLRDGIERAARLVDQLLTLARLEPETMSSDAPPLRLRPLLESCLERASEEILKRDLEVDLSCDPNASVQALPAALDMMVGNLLANAVRYGSPGGRLRIRVDPKGEALRLTIENEGEPIPEALRERLFDRFYRPPDSPGLGAGLGLAIVRRAAELHGGHVTIGQPDDFPGARFTVTLPTAREAGSG